MGLNIGSVCQPVGRGGYLLGSFLEPEHPFFSDKVEIAWKKIEPEDLSAANKHLHQKTEEIFLVLEGGIVLLVDGEELTINKGNFTLVKPGYVHQVIDIKKGTVLLIIKAPSVPGGDTVRI